MQKRTLLSLAFLFLFLAGFSQGKNRAFAITGQSNANFNWTDIRTIQLNSGDIEDVLYESGVTKFLFKNALTNKAVESIIINVIPTVPSVENRKVSSEKIEIVNPSPTFLKSAALAYDYRQEKLFFASMHTGHLSWLDLRHSDNTPVFYTIDQPLVKNEDFQDESLNITRMGMGADGKGYAITNDGSQVVSFTTGKNTVITNLGGLIDAVSNNDISIQNRCTSWGGDIIGHVSGKLILFSAAQNVFEIDLSNRVTTYLGRVKNLPANFSLNGAAVDEEDQVIVSSANTFEGYYKINMEDLSAKKLETKGKVFNASDLASSYLLGHSKQKTGNAVLASREMIGNKFISVYPNPVYTGNVKIGFDKMEPGKYTIALTDLQGRLIERKSVNILYKGQVENYTLKTKPVKGIYMIKITDAGKKNIFSDKLIIEN